MFVLRGVGSLLPMTVQPSAPGAGVAAGVDRAPCAITKYPDKMAKTEATPFVRLMLGPPAKD
jgi:hypothetical protein